MAILDDGRLCGVGTLGRPNAPALQDGVTAYNALSPVEIAEIVSQVLHGDRSRAVAITVRPSVRSSEPAVAKLRVDQTRMRPAPTAARRPTIAVARRIVRRVSSPCPGGRAAS